MLDIKATIVWVLLVATTLIMFFLTQNGFKPQLLVALLLAAAWFKGQLIIDHFMGLRHVAVLWRSIVSLWLFFILSVTFSVYMWAGADKLTS